MALEDPEIQRLAAESLAARTGMTVEAAIDGLEFQERAMRCLDEVERALAETSADQWFDWSDRRGRLKIGVATRAEPTSIEAARQILERNGLADRSDFVMVVWTTKELETAQERAGEVLGRLKGSWATGRDASTNSVWMGVPCDLSPDQIKQVKAAVRAAGVSVRVEPGNWEVTAT